MSRNRGCRLELATSQTKSESRIRVHKEREIIFLIFSVFGFAGWFSVMTERGQVKARQYTTVQRLIAAQVTAFLIIGPDVIGYYQNHQKIAGNFGL